MRLLLDPVWNWPIILLASLVMPAVVIGTALTSLRQLTPGYRKLLISLRAIAALLLIFSMLRPSLEIVETDQRRAEIAFLLDVSKSMTTPDMPGGLTRREALVKLLQDNSAAWAKLSEQVDLQLLDFDTALHSVTEPSTEAEGQYTSLGKVLDDFREQEKNENLIGLFIISDFAQRALGEADVSPLAAARRLAEQRALPLYTVLTGTSELSSSGIDLSVEDLTLDQPVTFEKKSVPVRAQVRLLGAAGRPVTVRLLVEDRLGKRLGESGELKPMPLTADSAPLKEIRTNENSALLNVELSFIAEQAGEYKIALEVVPAPNEVKTSNNRLETLVTVRKGGLRAAYIDIPRPEMGQLRRLNQTAKIQLNTRVVVPGQTIVDPQLFARGQYDVYLIGDVPAAAFGSGNTSLLTQLVERLREGAGLAMLGGQHNYGAGGYANSPLGPILPVQMNPADRIPLDQIDPRQHINRPIKMLPTRDGIFRYPMRLTAGDNAAAWEALPEMDGANRLVPKNNAVSVFAETADKEPLFLATDIGGSRVAALAVDQTWKWHLKGHAVEHQRFWQQLILWLARKELDSDQPVWARVDPRHFSPLAPVPIEMGAQDENGQPLPDARFAAEVFKPDGTVEPLRPQRQGDNYFAEYAKNDLPGDYWVKVTGTKDGQPLGDTVMTRFVVDSRDLEMDNPAADPGLMTQLANLTGGSEVDPGKFGEFLETLLKEGIPDDLQRYRRINLWDGWPLLILFTLLLSAEWTLRKLKGLV